MIYFDPKLLSFLDDRVHIIPNYAIKISEQKRSELLSGMSESLRLQADAKGHPFLEEITPPAMHVDIQLNRAKNEIRALREPMLSAVTGIGWEASEAGDAALVQEARNIRNALRDITDDPALNAAQTYEEMRAAGMSAFRRIASDASEAFSATFREFK